MSRKDVVIGHLRRLLTATKMTYYDIFARHYRKILRPEIGDPYVGEGWVPVTRFYGAGTTWSTAVEAFSASAGPAGGLPIDASHTPLLVTQAPNGTLNLAWGEPCQSADSDSEVD